MEIDLHQDKVNASQVRELLRAFRKIDKRAGALGNIAGRSKTNRDSGNLKIVLIYGLYGSVFAMFAISRLPAYLYSNILVSYTAVMVCLFITAEAGTLLFNSQDSEVLGHLPISPRTYYRAKCLNLFNYIILITVPLNTIPAFAGVLCRGANWMFPIAHAITTLLTAGCVAAIVILFYGVLMRFVRKEKLQSVITYSQIFLGLFFAFGYQLAPRMMGTYKFGAEWHGPWWLHIYPPAWFASLTQVLIGSVKVSHLLQAAVALAIAGTAIYLGLQRFASDYQSSIMQFSEEGGSVRSPHADAPDKPASSRGNTARLGPRLARLLFIRRPEERAVFDLVWLQVARDNEIKQRLYPSLAWMIGMPLLGLMTGQAADPLIEGGRGNPSFSYISVFLAGSLSLTVLELLQYSKNPDAAYIFQVSPIEKMGALYSGMCKAVMGGVVIPLILIMGVLFAWQWHSPVHALMHLLPWIFIVWPMTYLPFLWHDYLPFSRIVKQGQQATRNMAIMLAVMVGLGGVAFVQHLSYEMHFYWIFALSVVVLSTGIALLLRLLVSRKRHVLISA